MICFVEMFVVVFDGYLFIVLGLLIFIVWVVKDVLDVGGIIFIFDKDDSCLVEVDLCGELVDVFGWFGNDIVMSLLF